MADQRSKKMTRRNRTTRGLVIGAITAGALMIPVAPALAQPFTPADWGNAPVQPTQVASHGQAVANAAQSKIGSPYVWGATGPNAFDCSGLVQWSYKQAGISVPRTSYDQVAGGTPVSKGNLQPGDAVAFYGGDHIGIYIGDGMMVHASTYGTPVRVAPVDNAPIYNVRRY